MLKCDLSKFGTIGAVIFICAFGSAGLISSLQKYDVQPENSMVEQYTTDGSFSTESTSTTTTDCMATTTASESSYSTESTSTAYTTVIHTEVQTDAVGTELKITEGVVATTTTTTTTETVPVSPDVSNKAINISDSDIYKLAALVTLESGNEGYDCQKAVASTVINRMLIYGRSLDSIIYENGQYSVAYRVSSTTPFESALLAVNDVVYNGTTLPIYVTYFRARYYHSWGDQIPYCCMDNTYFSYSQALRNQYE